MPVGRSSGDSRLQLLLHLGELLLGHGSFSLPQLLQLLSRCIKVWPWRGWRDLHHNNRNPLLQVSLVLCIVSTCKH